MPTYLVTGANRGIGFQIAKKWSLDPQNLVVATTRSFERAKSLQDLRRPNLEIILLDVSGSLETIERALRKSQFLALGVDVVVQNAGVLAGASGLTSQVPIDNFSYHFEQNTLSSIKLYQAVYPYWKKSTGKVKKFVFISSHAGSMGGFVVPTFGYGMSKAAVNFFAKHISWEHAHSDDPVLRNSITVAIHPGVVYTDMGKEGIERLGLSDLAITPQQSGNAVVEVVDQLEPSDNGRFINYDGSRLEY